LFALKLPIVLVWVSNPMKPGEVGIGAPKGTGPMTGALPVTISGPAWPRDSQLKVCSASTYQRSDGAASTGALV